MREFELKCIIENLQLELDFQDLTQKQEIEIKNTINEAKKELIKLNN